MTIVLMPITSVYTAHVEWCTSFMAHTGLDHLRRSAYENVVLVRCTTEVKHVPVQILTPLLSCILIYIRVRSETQVPVSTTSMSMNTPHPAGSTELYQAARNAFTRYSGEDSH